VGTLQELMSLLADKLKIKRKRFNFIFAHSVRMILFILFIFLSTTLVLHVVYEGEVYANSLYDYVNAFHGMELGMPVSFLDALAHYLPLLLTILLALKYYRPFCHFLCPVGLFTHWLEQVSLFKVSLKRSKCNDCKVCVKEAPCEAMDDILKEATLRPDCYACNKCVETCPEDALKIGTKKTQ
jgi:polyferredoxin